jgi:hypothetical protein
MTPWGTTLWSATTTWQRRWMNSHLNRMQLYLQFSIYFLPVPSGFHMYTLAFRSILRVVYALPTAQDISTRKCRLLHHGWLLAQLSSATSRMTLGAIVVCYITDDSWHKCRLLDHGYNAVTMTLGPAVMLCPVFCTGSWKKMMKMSKRVKYCGSTHNLRPPPDEGGDVCKVRLRSVQKCEFV